MNIDPEPAKSEAIKATENARASINSTRPRTTLPRSGFVQPWGGSFEAASISGNYADAAAEAKGTGFGYIKGYRDGFATTAPVMSFPANEFGLHDMGGNLFEWCAGCYNGKDPAGRERSLTDDRVLRGGSWYYGRPGDLLSSCRIYVRSTYRYDNRGFRVVVVGRSGG